MTRARLFEHRIAVRLNAPGSKYHHHTGTVDAHELERVHGKDKALTLKLDNGETTIACGDELVLVDSPPLGPGADNGVSESPA